MYYWHFWPFYLVREVYWCFIPDTCRKCPLLKDCRKGIIKGRKCYNGCIKINNERAKKAEEAKEDYLNSLLDYMEKERWYR